MSYIKIHNPVQTEFAMVPNVLWSWPSLSFKAKGFFAYLLSFRHGVCPSVAAMEAETGLGRDARKAVMRELEAAGLARWVVQRDASARIVAKFLEVTTAPLLIEVGARVQRAESSHAPEKPSDGFSGGEVRKISRSSTGFQAISEREREKKVARAANARAAGRSASSRVETARPASSVASCAVDRGGASAPSAAPALSSEEKARRAAFVAGLGLPVRDPSSGVWQAAASVLAESGGGR